MAISVLSSVNLLAEKLTSFIGQFYLGESQSRARKSQAEIVLEDLSRLSRLLGRIRALMRDAARREIRDQSVRLWLLELKAVVACDAEDVLDEYHYEVLRCEAMNQTSPETSYEGRSVQSSFSHPTDELGVNSVRMDDSKLITTHLEKRRSCLVPTNILILDEWIDKVKNIFMKFEEISQDRNNLRFNEEDGKHLSTSQNKRHPTSSFVEENSIVGRDNDEIEMINLLNQSSARRVVVPIVGTGGLGKTTIAQCIYNNARFNEQFDHKVWIHVGYNGLDAIHLNRVIIESITKQPCGLTELSVLQDVVREKLKGKRLFIVLDDVWDENKSLWESFRDSLPTATTVRILTTSRSMNAASTIQTVTPYRLDSLCSEFSWELFKLRAFGKEAEQYENLLEIGKAVVEKCHGNPLAVKSLAGLLSSNMDEERWRDLLETELFDLNEDENVIMPVLRLSYEYLPYHLKPCFLFLSHFPRDYIIEGDHLVNMWIAQGFIEATSSRTLEETAFRYIDELVARSLLDTSGKHRCQMHDLIHDMACKISEEDRSLVPSLSAHVYAREGEPLDRLLAGMHPKSVRTLLNYRLGDFPTESPIFGQMTTLRVLQLDVCDFELLYPVNNLKHLRYLDLFGRDVQYLPESICSLYNLNTLEVSCSSLLELPPGIGSLKQLKYLKLFSVEIKQLPESLSLLHNLESLNVSDCQKLFKLPMGINRLTSLCNLHVLSTSLSGLPTGIHELVNLRRIEAKMEARIDEEHKGLGVLKNLVNLKGTLIISGLSNIVHAEHSKRVDLISKRNIRSLQLNWRAQKDDPVLSGMDLAEDAAELKLELTVSSCKKRKREDVKEAVDIVLDSLKPHRNLIRLEIGGYEGSRYPGWMGDHSALLKLTTLILKHSHLVESSMLPSLGQLQSLKILLLIEVGVKNIGEELCRSSANSCSIGFPSLERLEFIGLSKWEQWSGVFERDFPHLKRLCIKNCRSLQILPVIPSSVEILMISDCNVPQIQLSPSFHLKEMHMRNCWRLSSIHGLQTPNSCTQWSFEMCPSLNVSLAHILQSLPETVEISNCPQVITWRDCLEGDLFQRMASQKVLFFTHSEAWNRSNCMSSQSFSVLMFTKENPLDSGELLPPFCSGMSQSRWLNLPLLEKLEVSCANVISVSGLYNLRNLKHLQLMDCSKLRLWQDDSLPSALITLVLQNCDKICLLPPFDRTASVLEVLEISNCLGLTKLHGLGCITTMRILSIVNCRDLYISPVDKLSCSPPDITISNCPKIRDWCRANNITPNIARTI